MKKILTAFIGLMALVGCATTSAPKYEGVFVPKELADKFEPGIDAQSLRWIKPGVDFSKYHKVMVDYVVFALSPHSEYKGIDADEMKKLADAASKALVDALAKQFTIVAEPGRYAD
jgi:hypothetical protein